MVKRSDVTTGILLGAVQEHGHDAWDVLCEQYPPKVVLAALYRELGRDHINYGTCVNHPWLTEAGERALDALL